MTENEEYHIPVLLQEVLDGLQIIPSGTYVDCTFGGGGHSREILKRLGKDGRLIAFDQDMDAGRNVPDDSRVTFIPQNFRHLKRFLRLHDIGKVNGILADLGISSHQINMPERGFSTRFEASLDMRMDQKAEKTAGDILQKYSEEDLHRIFEKYGEVTNSRTLARSIVSLRKIHSLRTVREFKNALFPIVKGNPEKYFAQVFQALRIEVNDELGSLEDLLSQAVDLLDTGGRIAVITFHSLEDRIVKNFFKHGPGQESGEPDLFGNKSESPMHLVHKKPVVPTQDEVKRNPRARSSKLRVAEKK